MTVNNKMLNLLLIILYITSTEAVTLIKMDDAKDLGNKEDVGVVRDKLLWVQGQTGIVTIGKL